jgi:hypothetical protein
MLAAAAHEGLGFSGLLLLATRASLRGLFTAASPSSAACEEKIN